MLVSSPTLCLRACPALKAGRTEQHSEEQRSAAACVRYRLLPTALGSLQSPALQVPAWQLRLTGRDWCLCALDPVADAVGASEQLSAVAAA